MRTAFRRVAFVGEMSVAVTEALRAQGCRVERIDGTSVVGVAREMMRLRPAVVHARAAYLKVGLVARLLDVPVVGSTEVVEVEPEPEPANCPRPRWIAP